MATESEAFVAVTARDPALVGRDDEVQTMRAALRGLRAGAGRAIAITGEPGIGKSTLMAALTAEARAAGIPVLAGHGREPNPLYLPGAPPGAGRDPREPGAHRTGPVIPSAGACTTAERIWSSSPATSSAPPSRPRAWTTGATCGAWTRTSRCRGRRSTMWTAPRRAG